jgi:aspartate ammonia-lyase
MNMQVSLRRVLKQMHSMPGAKNPMLALKLKDESKDDFKFTFQSEAEKDQMKEMVPILYSRLFLSLSILQPSQLAVLRWRCISGSTHRADSCLG